MRVRIVAMLVMALLAVVVVAGCGGDDEEGAGGAATGGGEQELSGTIAGAGASSMAAAQEAWVAGFQQKYPKTTVTYDPIGSGGGREQFTAGGTLFGGTDAELKDEELEAGVQGAGAEEGAGAEGGAEGGEDAQVADEGLPFHA